MLCGIDKYGNGTYTPEAIIQIAEALKVNHTLQSIKYATDSNQFTIQPCTPLGPSDAIWMCAHVASSIYSLLRCGTCPASLCACPTQVLTMAEAVPKS